MFSRLSVRARITLGSSVVAAALLGVALVVVHLRVGAVLTHADVSLARSDLTPFAAEIATHQDEIQDDPGTGVLVSVRSPAGQLEVNTLPHDVAREVEHHDATDGNFTMTDDEDRSYVVVGRVVTTGDGGWTLWAARSTAASKLALEGLDRLLLVGSLLLLLCFAVASWVLTSVALRPVTAMRRRAEALGGAGDGTLPVGPAQDELAALATTLNTFLARVRATADREKRMVSDTAHELRTPLAALKTQLELAHRDFGDAAALAAQVRAAEVSVERLASLASNLLELSRLESRDAVGSSTAGDLVEEFTGSIDRARMLGLAKSADITFEVHVENRSASYRLDAQALGRVADNLLANAVRAIDDGGAVRAALTQAPDSLTLTVQDDGPGMPPDFVQHAFERFSRPDESRTAASGGSGLGLALVQAVADAAGGQARARNTHPGLEVTVSVPKVLVPKM
ncbi:HAMP domain-containing histidine kinase [Myceligenerans sp. I2]|uniref:histidine kinase n=2 Tax=Myceligenerans indicum TaxID=2593663 RepID=A0ABS1LHQ5_9MICO|nr:HAMP domain-containing histidine kinase [Myceligenerans indicum]